MSALRTAALVAALLGLAGCTDEEINTGIANLKGDPTPEQAALLTPEQQASVVATHPELVASSSSVEPPRFVMLEIGGGPMGEDIATGPDCHPTFRTLICR